MPRFSLVVPTLRRADTLEHAVATLLAQPEHDVEIVIQNNGNDAATRALVERVADSRLKHFSTDEMVPMSENWELALANASGELITFIGDDDGLLPDACNIAGDVFAQDPEAELLSWAPFLYLWPTYWNERRRNRLQARVSFDFEIRSEPTQPLLEQFYSFRAHYSELPMLYNSFVRRSLVERVRGRCGKYFFGSLPDVSSGIVDAAFTETFLRSSRPLSVAGLSGNSSGQRLSRSVTRPSPEEIKRDFPALRSEPDTNVERLIAGEMAVLEREVLREHRPVTLEHRRLPWAMAAAINESPSRYDETRTTILALMERFGIPPAELMIPARLDHPPAPADGMHPVGPREALFVFDGTVVGLESIADAVGLASQIVPRADAAVRLTSTEIVPLVSEAPLSLARDGDGRHALVSGWSEGEPWGTWSVERECVLRLRLPDGERPVRLGLRYRTLPAAGGRPRIVERAHEEHELDEQGELILEVSDDAGLAEIRLVNVERESPYDLGASDDTRPLGIGVEEIRVLR
jgi:hypothetical protein